MELNEERKTLFNKVASAYNSYRPGYPRSAIDELISNTGIESGARLFEIGCGTGQATEMFARHGFDIDAVELGADTVSMARSRLHGYPNVTVHHSPFESFAAGAGSYQLVYSAQAFHWIDVDSRLSRCRDFLSSRGTLALMYNYTPPQGDAFNDLSWKIEDLSRGALTVIDSNQVGKGIAHWSNELGLSSLFDGLSVRVYPWECSYGAEEYIGLFRTYSDFVSLPSETQHEIESTIRAAIGGSDDTITRRYLCTVFTVQRAD